MIEKLNGEVVKEIVVRGLTSISNSSEARPSTLKREGRTKKKNFPSTFFRLSVDLRFFRERPGPIFCTHVEIVVKSMPKRRKSSKQLEKDREENRERMSEFCKKKTEEQALKDSLARQQALKQLGITQEFNYSDHAEIYSYADRAHAAPIETIEASIPPPKITQYPERSPCPSPCSVRGEQINHALTPTARTAVARFRRAKAIMQANCAK